MIRSVSRRLERLEAFPPLRRACLYNREESRGAKKVIFGRAVFLAGLRLRAYFATRVKTSLP